LGVLGKLSFGLSKLMIAKALKALCFERLFVVGQE
jgi:hypothetical protein